MSFENAGILLKSYRKSISMTQLELSKKSKVHSQFVSNWERGKCLPPVPVMKKIYKSMTSDQRINFKDAIQQDFTSSYMKKIE